MSRQHSPFAALTSREQQERWLEFQNTRLPYIQGEVDAFMDHNGFEETTNHSYVPAAPTQREAQAHHQSMERPQPPQVSPQNLQSFQKTSHRQYDAVIQRMMNAGKQATQFHSV